MMLQVAILLLTLAMFYAIQYLPKRALTKLRSRDRASIQTNRHLVQASHLLARARATTNRSHSQTLAKTALAEAETALSLSPKVAAPHILRALALDLLGHRTAALKSLDLSLSRPLAKSLAVRERADALVKRAELRMAVNLRRRVDSAVEDLEEAVRLSDGGAGGDGDSSRAFCLLGQCYEFKGMKERARWAFQETLRVDPESVVAREGMDRLGP